MNSVLYRTTCFLCPGFEGFSFPLACVIVKNDRKRDEDARPSSADVRVRTVVKSKSVGDPFEIHSELVLTALSTRICLRFRFLLLKNTGVTSCLQIPHFSSSSPRPPGQEQHKSRRSASPQLHGSNAENSAVRTSCLTDMFARYIPPIVLLDFRSFKRSYHADTERTLPSFFFLECLQYRQISPDC